MTTHPLFQGFDGLMTLSRREGVDIRPTLLRVLTDLFVQANNHSAEEERHFTELASRLIDQVDDSTRAAVRARLGIYPGTPAEIRSQLGLRPADSEKRIPLAEEAPEKPARATIDSPPPTEAQLRMSSNLPMRPTEAAEINELFLKAGPSERAKILHNLKDTPLKAAARVHPARALRSLEALEMAAFVADLDNFVLELAETLLLPTRLASQIVNDPGGEPLACAAKALGMRSAAFQKVLMFLIPEYGVSVERVYRLARLYDRLSERSSLVMLAAWRGASLAHTRTKYRPSLHDDERYGVRSPSANSRPAPSLPVGGNLRSGLQRPKD